MTENYENTDTLYDRLLIAGTNEIGQHGVADFSLRRVAAACGMSCAAPYKHFKNKEEFIVEIIQYINRQWELLRNQILSLFEGDVERQIIEICLAYIRFWVANPNYRSVLTASEKALGKERANEKTKNSEDLEKLIRNFSEMRGIHTFATQQKLYKIKAILYGMTTMLESGELSNNTETFEMIREMIADELKA